MTHATLARTVGLLATGSLMLAAVAAPSAALATQPAPGHTVTICHATNSDSNPYRLLRVDVASSGYLQGGHATEHTGPVWSPTLKADHIAWGDIIPSFTYGESRYDGQNLSDEGRVILANDCVVAAAGDPAGDPAAADEPVAGAPAAGEPAADLVAAEVPTAEEPTAEAPSNATPTPATATDESPLSHPGDGEVVIDGPFVTPTPDATPVGRVLHATGAPEMTPPSTDTIDGNARSTPGSGLQLLLLAVAGLSSLMLIAGRVPAVRRS